MNIPSIPTDNLYKFIAIFGLIIFFSGIYLNFERSQNIEQIAKELFISQELDSWATSRKEYALELVKNDSTTFTKEEHIAHYMLRVDSVINLELVRLGKKPTSNLYEIKYEMFLLKEKYNIIYKILIYIGIILMVIGFGLWYFKHQRYIDAEKKWKGETFVELLKDEEAKKKAIQDELNKKKNQQVN